MSLLRSEATIVIRRAQRFEEIVSSIRFDEIVSTGIVSTKSFENVPRDLFEELVSTKSRKIVPKDRFEEIAFPESRHS